MMRRVNEIAEGVAQGMDAKAKVDWLPNGYPVTVNDPALTERMVPTLARVAGGVSVRHFDCTGSRRRSPGPSATS
jgi:amidohydrolase